MTKAINKEKLTDLIKWLRRYKIYLFIGFVVIVYVFIIFKGNQLSNATPSATAIAKQTQSVNYPHIDQSTINKINQLQDNSVNVQSLFNQARQNPFQE